MSSIRHFSHLSLLEFSFQHSNVRVGLKVQERIRAKARIQGRKQGSHDKEPLLSRGLNGLAIMLHQYYKQT